MSNNNRSSNRRRGRGGNRSQGGGNQGNRIDSRARGNAPQLLEKYRKLAHDASLNGDRVQAEYYLQFADHYFRVLADSRAQRDDQRPRHERDPQDGYDDDYDDDRGQNRGQPQQQRNNRDRYDPDDRDSEGRGSDERDSDEYESSENPFTREERAPREERGAREERGNREERGRSRRNRNEAPRGGEEGEAGFDASILPPAIGKGDDEVAEKPRKPRRTKSRGSDEESLETVE